MACSQDARRPSVSTTDFPQLRQELIGALGLEDGQVNRVREVRAKRDNARVSKALNDLKNAARGTDNLMPYILDSVRAYATEGEIMTNLIEVFGIYTEQAVI